jgi:hypothetical protein
VTGLWIAAGVAAWIVIAVPVGLIIGRSIRIADDARPSRARRHAKRTVYRCSRCGRQVDYATEQVVDAVGSIHEFDCSPAMTS